MEKRSDGRDETKRLTGSLLGFVLREWLLAAAAAGFLLTAIEIGRLDLCSAAEAEILLLLWALFVVVRGLENSGLMARLARRLEGGSGAAVKLVVATFFLAMLVTNDAALVVIVPLTLGLDLKRRDLLVICEALAANAGAALSPLGNPQNLFIYWFYQLGPLEFMRAMAAFSLPFLLLLPLLAGRLARQREPGPPRAEAGAAGVSAKAVIYFLLLLVVLLSVLHLLPSAAGFAVLFFALLFDRRSLKVDYALLFTFLFFFGLTGNLKIMLARQFAHGEHVFLLSALASQIISNVPAALLFAKFTTNWKALLWGVNTGGFGSLFGSFANLIAWRLYLAHRPATEPPGFTLRFLLFGYGAFFLAAGLYFLVGRGGLPG